MVPDGRVGRKMSIEELKRLAEEAAIHVPCPACGDTGQRQSICGSSPCLCRLPALSFRREETLARAVLNMCKALERIRDGLGECKFDDVGECYEHAGCEPTYECPVQIARNALL